MARAVLFIALLAACTGVALSASLTPAMPTDAVDIPAAIYSTSGAAAFTFNPTLLTSTNATITGVKTFKDAGMSSKRNAAFLPAIRGSGLSQTYFEVHTAPGRPFTWAHVAQRLTASLVAAPLEPCALRSAHSHMDASGLLYVIDANALAVAVVLQDGGPAVVNTVTTGASTVFPQGLIHYQQNMDCLQPAKYLITYNNESPGLQNTFTALFELPPDAIQAALGIDRAQLLTLYAGMPATSIYQDATSLCHEQCKLAGATTFKAEVPVTGLFASAAPEAVSITKVFGRR